MERQTVVTDPDRATDEPRCFHCAAPADADRPVTAMVDGEMRTLCCPACAAVATTIDAAGLAHVYALAGFTPATAREPGREELETLALYDHPAVIGALASRVNDGLEVVLHVGGMRCAACAWLVEQRLASMPAVKRIEVNFTHRRARLGWDPARTGLGALLAEVCRLGYDARPFDRDQARALLTDDARRAMRGVALAGLLGMQVMLIAVSLYAGEWWGMSEPVRALLTWSGVGLAGVIIALPGRAFFVAAARDLRSSRVGMDVPVALGLGAAFAGSLYSAWRGTGDLYIDSIAMFVFLLLLARGVELGQHLRNRRALDDLEPPRLQPATHVLPDGAVRRVSALSLAVGERIRVAPGEIFPADIRIERGRSTVDESILSGECRPRTHGAGDLALGGSLNLDGTLEGVVENPGSSSYLRRLLERSDEARNERPRLMCTADRVAGVFVLGVLVLAAVAGMAWSVVEPSRVLPVVISVLVVTCPCALSLATPSALGAGLAALARRGVLVLGTNGLERLARISQVVFDKTGTLTTGNPALARCTTLAERSVTDCIALAAGLEAHDTHPLARGFVAAAGERPIPVAHDVVRTPGAGLTGCVAGQMFAVGSGPFAARFAGLPCPASCDDTTAYLADRRRLLARFTFTEDLRADAASTVAALASRGIESAIVSGDRAVGVKALAHRLGIQDAVGGASPTDKAAHLAARGLHGPVAMVGDGVNDAIALGAADLGIAVGSAPAMVRSRADVALLDERLLALPEAITVARLVRRRIRQNLAWAVIYNTIALPAAVFGLLSPWMAAIGMSLSSLAVVINSTRLDTHDAAPRA